VKNPCVVAEQNALSEEILDVRENAHKIPHREKWPSEKERFSPEKGHF
jgi:hypothetical protein